MIDFFDKGGLLMWPIILCSVAAVTVIIERIIYFILHQDRSSVLKQAQKEISGKKYNKAVEILASSKGSLAVFLSSVVEGRTLAKDEHIAQVITVGDEILLKMRRGLFVLTLVERAAPLIGFLGTVIGMIFTFAAVSGADGQVHPADLAGGIWQALVTTAGGLAVAIPVMAAHHLFDTYISYKAAKMKQIGDSNLVLIQGKKK